MPIFSMHQLFNGILIFFPITVFFTPMFLVLYLIRHSSKNKLPGIITSVILSVSTWIFLVPVSYTLIDQDTIFAPVETPSLTPGYFRHINNSIYYFTSVDSASKVNGLSIDKNYFSGKDSNHQITIFHDQDFAFERDDNGFIDPIIAKMMNTPKPIVFIFQGLFKLIIESVRAISKGILSWLLFSSIIIALASTSAITECTSWRLANAFHVVAANSCILLLNFLFYAGLYDRFLNKISSVGFGLHFVKDNFQVLMNGTISLLLILIGVFSYILKHKKNGDD